MPNDVNEDVDDLVRGAMKSLDGETPSGYFDDLPIRTLGRLEASMQSQGPTVSTASTTQAGSTGVPPGEDAVREEDSGLHDIRSLATSQRMRNSSKRITTSPPVDENILAASSAGWKAVALPVAEPAREMPAPLDKKRASRSSKQMAAELAPIPSLAQSAPTPIGAHLAKKQKSKAPLYAIASLGLAAAAGAAIYVTTQKDSPAEQAAAIAASSNGSTVEPVPRITPIPGVATATPIEQPPAVPAPAAPAAEATAAAAAPTTSDGLVAQAEISDERADEKDRDASKSPRAKGKKARAAEREVVAKTEAKKPDPKLAKGLAGSGAAVIKPTGKADKEEPSFEELLKEANIPDKKQADEKPKLEKKSLSSADIKKGMSSVAAKAQGCYNGTQGTASVKLVVDPSGKVSKVSVTGAFAGTPVAACVEKAVKAASFPPWDGGPQSFGYSYLLSE
jgi:hypothetical protein